jgi:hypothetical protein
MFMRIIYKELKHTDEFMLFVQALALCFTQYVNW